MPPCAALALVVVVVRKERVQMLVPLEEEAWMMRVRWGWAWRCGLACRTGGLTCGQPCGGPASLLLPSLRGMARGCHCRLWVQVQVPRPSSKRALLLLAQRREPTRRPLQALALQLSLPHSPALPQACVALRVQARPLPVAGVLPRPALLVLGPAWA